MRRFSTIACGAILFACSGVASSPILDEAPPPPSPTSVSEPTSPPLEEQPAEDAGTRGDRDAGRRTRDAAVVDATVDAGPAPVIVASGQTSPVAVRLDAQSVYWATSNGQPWKAPKAGGGAPLAPSFTGPARGLAIDGSDVYWTIMANSGSVQRVALGGGTPTAAASAQTSPVGIALDVTYLYWCNFNGTVMRMLRGGTAPAPLASSQSYPSGIALDDTSVYWTNVGNNGGAAVMRAPKDGSTGPTAFAATQQPGFYPVGPIVVDVTNVYFSTASRVLKLAKAGGAATILADNQNGISSLAIDASNIYWTTYAGGTVSKVDLDAVTQPVTLAQGQTHATGIAVDATHVYWATQTTIAKTPK